MKDVYGATDKPCGEGTAANPINIGKSPQFIFAFSDRDGEKLYAAFIMACREYRYKVR